jgi:hypothetical protein
MSVALSGVSLSGWRDHANMRVEPLERTRGTFGLVHSDMAGVMQDLPLQVRQRHHIVIVHAENANAGGCEIA